MPFYPFAAAGYDAVKAGDSYQIGADIFWRPSSNLQLTATLNPDFGSVESDRVVVNLGAFEVFFSEQRDFFLEGFEIFIATPRADAGFGNNPTTMLNTRRIGGRPITSGIPEEAEVADLESSQPSELDFALKATGQQGRWRYGSLIAVEDETLIRGTLGGDSTDFSVEGRDFGILRLLYEDTSQGGRLALGWMGTLVDHPEERSLVNGIDLHYYSRGKKWSWDGQFLFSDTRSAEDGDSRGFGAFVDGRYVPRQGYRYSMSLDFFDDSLDINSLGFLRRNDAVSLRAGFERRESNLQRLRSRVSRISLSQEYNTDGLAVRSGIFTRRAITLHNRDDLWLRLNFFPGRWDDRSSRDNGAFRIKKRWDLQAGYSTDSARPVSGFMEVRAREEQLGGLTRAISVGFDWRPVDRFSLVARVGFEERNGWLLHQEDREFTTFKASVWRPRLNIDYFLSARQQFRMTLQWTGIRAREQAFFRVPEAEGKLLPVSRQRGAQSDDFSISRLVFQLRYRWEIAPLSELFIVYTRGSDLPNRPEDSFQEQLRNAWFEETASNLAIKLRYRIGR